MCKQAHTLHTCSLIQPLRLTFSYIDDDGKAVVKKTAKPERKVIKMYLPLGVFDNL